MDISRDPRSREEELGFAELTSLLFLDVNAVRNRLSGEKNNHVLHGLLGGEVGAWLWTVGCYLVCRAE